MSEDEETAATAAGFAAGAGTFIAEATGVAGPVGTAVAGAAVVGAAIGTGIEYATDGAISDALADGLHSLVGEEESYQAAQAFDDGEYLSGAGHMIAGAADTIGDAAGDAVDWVSDTASDAADWAGDTASDAVDAVGDFIEDIDLNPFD